ncbi:MAG: heavy metal translocating P-type ATPase [Candidatus Izemoplasmatales bacterium]
MKKIKLNLIGMSCASCANTIDQYLKNAEGIIEANINLATEVANVTYDESIITSQDIINLVKKSGYDANLFQEKVNVSFAVEGMTCANCARTIEMGLSKIEGIDSIVVNIATDKLNLAYDDSQVKISDIKKKVSDLGYSLKLESNTGHEDQEDFKKMKSAKDKLIKASFLTSIIMLMMIVHMFIINIPGYTIITSILAFPIVFILGRHVHIGAFKSLKIFKPNMDVLVSLGSLPPYLIGLMGLFLPITTFIEMASTIMTFHLIGKYLESRAKGKASQAIKKLVEMGAKQANILVDDQEIQVLTSELSKGDIMVIRPGEKIPTDGRIIEGQSLIDESLATGESMPVKRGMGDEVIGATINKQGLLKVQVTKTGNETFLSQIIELVEACQGSKVPIQAFADKVTGYFVPAIMVITLLTFISFNVFSDFHLGILNYFDNILPWIQTDQSILSLSFITATAVLVIACPCALGLGTPTALMVGSGIGSEHGILIRNGEAVQTFKDIKAIAFDKTGTLTYGKPMVTDIISEDKEKLLKLAYTLEKGSEHVLAQSIIDKAKTDKIQAFELKNFQALVGQGIKGDILQETYYLGNRQLLIDRGIDFKDYENQMVSLENEAKTVVILAKENEVLGLIAIRDELKSNIKRVIHAIENLGIKTAMITGDNRRTAEAIGKKAGISVVISEVYPDGKVDEIKKLQDEFGLVAMVGDGINDAPALKQANVGIAIGTGTDVAIEAADVTLVNGDIANVLQAIRLSQAIFKKIKENFFWAWFYNGIAIPFAIFGLLHPMIGAAAMSLSSLNVIYNSLRLKKMKFNKLEEI